MMRMNCGNAFKMRATNTNLASTSATASLPPYFALICEGVFVIDESTATDWPILLSATVRSKIGYGATAEEQTSD
jgi:hypothetical protein